MLLPLRIAAGTSGSLVERRCTGSGTRSTRPVYRRHAGPSAGLCSIAPDFRLDCHYGHRFCDALLRDCEEAPQGDSHDVAMLRDVPPVNFHNHVSLALVLHRAVRSAPWIVWSVQTLTPLLPAVMKSAESLRPVDPEAVAPGAYPFRRNCRSQLSVSPALVMDPAHPPGVMHPNTVIPTADLAAADRRIERNAPFLPGVVEKAKTVGIVSPVATGDGTRLIWRDFG